MESAYKTICNSCFQKTEYETEQPCKRKVRVSCKSCYQPTGKYKPCPGTLKILDTSNLDPRFTPFYINHERIEVMYV